MSQRRLNDKNEVACRTVKRVRSHNHPGARGVGSRSTLRSTLHDLTLTATNVVSLASRGALSCVLAELGPLLPLPATPPNQRWAVELDLSRSSV